MSPADLSAAPRIEAVQWQAAAAAGPHGLVRLGEVPDVDAFGERLAAAWRTSTGARRGGARLMLSVVETCGRTGPEREGDALRLLQAESATPRTRGELRATLVRVDERVHLLLLTAAHDAQAALDALAEMLARQHPPGTAAPS
jgi:hypothetical protein